MRHYTIKTDAVTERMEAESLDEAAARFAAGEGLDATNAEELRQEIEGIDGAWLWIDENGDRVLRAGEQPR